MFTASVVVLFFGISFIVSGLVALLLRYGAWRARRIVVRTPLRPPGAVRPGVRRVATVGTTGFGSSGPQRAPVTGVDCAWYEAELVRRPPRGFNTEESYEDTLWRDWTPGPPVLVGDGTEVLLDPALLTRTSRAAEDPPLTVRTVRRIDPSQTDLIPSVVPAQVYSGTRRHETLELTELRLDAAVTAFAICGVVSERGQPKLVAASGPITTLTRNTRQGVLDRLADDSQTSRWLAVRLLAIGMVLSAVSVAGMVLFLPTE